MIAEQLRNASDFAAIKQIDVLQGEVAATMNTERSRQQTIGISEIGDPCRRTVARKLSGLYPKPHDPSWKAQVGTFIHGGLEEHFVTRFADRTILGTGPTFDPPTDERPHYAMERRLSVWDYKGFHLGGSCDLYVQGGSYGLVTDWKTQGTDKLLKKTAKGDIGQTYTVQMHTYGLGYELLGLNVTHVLLYALPRDGDLALAKPVLMRYDRTIAVNALKRLQDMIDAAEIVGWPTLVESQPRESFCFDCDKFEREENSRWEQGLFSQ